MSKALKHCTFKRLVFIISTSIKQLQDKSLFYTLDMLESRLMDTFDCEAQIFVYCLYAAKNCERYQNYNKCRQPQSSCYFFLEL